MRENNTTKEKLEMRAAKKMAQLAAEFKKSPLDWHSICHLSRDLNAAANARKQAK